MSLSGYLVLHKKEWDRLKRKQSPKQKCYNKGEYIRSLNEQSQNWIKMWPDTVEGHVYQLEKQKKLDHAKLIETVKQFISKRRSENKTECINTAKELIFEDSCYGRQLKSALLESKMLEERDAQIKFIKQLQQEAALQKKLESEATSLQNSSKTELIEKAMALCRKQKNVEIAQVNKAMFEEQNHKKVLEKEKNKELGEWSIQKLIEYEAQIKNTKAKLEKEEFVEYKAQKRKNEELKIAREEEEERQRKIWNSYQERVQRREKLVFDQIHKNKANKPLYEKIYKNIKKNNDDKRKEYNDFVEKGIERWLNRSKAQEKLEANTISIKRNKRKMLDEENRIIAKENRLRYLEENQKSACLKQSFIEKYCMKPKKNVDEPGMLCPRPKNKLLEDLKKREKTSSGNSLKATHAFFAQRASDTLRECRYKNMARKVVNDYRRMNCLDDKTLPISDY